MPRKAPEDSDEKVIHAATSFRPDVLRDYTERIEALNAESDAIAAGAKKKQAPKRQAIIKLMKEAAENGLEKKVLAAHLRKRRLQRQSDAVELELDDEHKDQFRKYQKAMPWEGTPLAMAAAAE